MPLPARRLAGLTLRPWRMREGSRWLLTTGSPRAASVGARMVARAAAVHRSSCGQQGQAGQGAGHDRQRQADAEQPGRHGRPRAAAVPSLTRTASVNSTRARVASARWPHELVGGVDLDQVQDLVADQQPEGHEHHRLGDRRWTAAAPTPPHSPSAARRWWAAPTGSCSLPEDPTRHLRDEAQRAGVLPYPLQPATLHWRTADRGASRRLPPRTPVKCPRRRDQSVGTRR